MTGTRLEIEKAQAAAQTVFKALRDFGYTHQCYTAIREGRITTTDLQPEFEPPPRADGVVIRPGYRDGELEEIALSAVTRALGATAIIADEALRERLGRPSPEDTSVDGSMRNVLYMVRCAFAHEGTSGPTWRCDREYRRTYVIPEPGISFDGSRLNGRPFDVEDLGGFVSYLRLLGVAHRRLQGFPIGIGE